MEKAFLGNCESLIQNICISCVQEIPILVPEKLAQRTCSETLAQRICAEKLAQRNCPETHLVLRKKLANLAENRLNGLRTVFLQGAPNLPCVGPVSINS